MARSKSKSDSMSRGGNDGAASESSGRVRIKPLSTIGDRGKPTDSVAKDLRRVVNLIQDERHLVANDLYIDCKRRMKRLREQQKLQEEAGAKQGSKGRDKTKRSWLSPKKTDPGGAFNAEEFEAALEIVRSKKKEFTVLEQRAPLFQACRDNMDESDGWTLAQTMFGVTTFYRREKDGSLSIKLEGELKGIPLFEQVAVLREIDLHSHWAPFVTSSLTIAHLDKLDTVGWFMLGLPNFGIARDSCFRAVGCDCVEEDQSVLIVGRGVADREPGAPVDEDTKFLSDDPELEGLDIPPKPTRMGSGRMTMKMFGAKIRVLGPDHCHTYILANIDPNLAFIPQALLEFVMKKLCGFLLTKLQSAAKKITKDPVRNVHAQRMRDEAAFYRDWLLPKFRNVAALRGWDTPTIAPFELSQAQQVEAEKLLERRGGEVHSFCHFESGETSNEGVDSTRSTPNMYPLDSKDDDSNISSLSGTSQSIWKNNPIASYLRDVETKTQDRKDKAVQDARRKATARLQPRPLPVHKKDRLQQLKEHKDRKLKARGFHSAGSTDGEDSTVVTIGTTRSAPYSPITAALDGQGRGRQYLVVTALVVLLFILLHGDRFLPSFSSLGGEWLSTALRDAVTLVYIFLCGAVHFLLCDVQLIYAFEAFEMGMKTGAQVKTFYRGQVRLLVAASSGLLVVISIAKAVALAWIKAALVWLFAIYKYCMSNYIGTSSDSPEINKEDGLVDGIGDESAPVASTTMLSIVSSALYTGYSAMAGLASAMMGLTSAIFEWQMNMFVRSNVLGRLVERLTTGVYNFWVGAASGLANCIYSLATNDDRQGSDDPGYSWRDDATSTLRVLLTYTAVFLLAVLAFLNLYTSSLRHRAQQDSLEPAPLVGSAMTNGESDHTSSPSGNNHGTMPKKVVTRAKSTDSGARSRLGFRRKMKEIKEDASL